MNRLGVLLGVSVSGCFPVVFGKSFLSADPALPVVPVAKLAKRICRTRFRVSALKLLALPMPLPDLG